jgi:hypothetical protein
MAVRHKRTWLAFAFDADERAQWSNVPYRSHRRPGSRLEAKQAGWAAFAQEVTRGVELVLSLTDSQQLVAISPAGSAR